MITFPSIDPDIVRIGPFAVRWYGMMYLLGFVASYVLVKRQIAQRNFSVPRDFVDSFYTFLVLGLILGARLGYVVFYNPSFYLEHPLDIFAVWQGGMSFHGGLIGSVMAGVFYCRRHRVDAWTMADIVVVTAPIGLGLGRLGNFINAELYGRVTSVSWGMVFPGGGPLPRHPSQLYEFFLEGIVLFAVLWTVKGRVRHTGVMIGLFLVLYGVFRFIVEFFREPDPQIGFIAGLFTMGQILSGSMIIIGALLIFLRTRREARA